MHSGRSLGTLGDFLSDFDALLLDVLIFRLLLAIGAMLSCKLAPAKPYEAPSARVVGHYSRLLSICVLHTSAFSWESVKNAVKGLGNKNKVQDILWDQIRRREFGGDAADGNPPGRPGGGGGADGTDDEGYGILEETLQVFLATIAFILVYIYIIRGADLTMLARDYFKYCVCGVQSMRLQRIINKWRRVCGPRSLRIGWNGQL
ncbi:hypothetical protein KSP40_PGU020629 [Platanthera guangdongensis]|uniref:Uncharacterized protein n=1 Tax=Platanthera guangdongensis TaxID=2320717 RepID=A0ABR2LBH1_9ASPA